MQDTLRVDGSYVFCVKPSCTAGQEHTGGGKYFCTVGMFLRLPNAWL
jgi:hypothetical protein